MRKEDMEAVGKAISVIVAKCSSRIIIEPVKEKLCCSECKYWDEFPSSTIEQDFHECRYYTVRIHTKADDYCSKAERRENE